MSSSTPLCNCGSFCEAIIPLNACIKIVPRTSDDNQESGNSECCEKLNSELDKLIVRIEELEKKQCHCGSDNTDDDTPSGGGDDGETDDANAPGKINLTLLGSTSADRFYGLVSTDDGYLACGNTDSANGVLLAKFDKKLALKSKSVISGGPSVCNSACLSATGKPVVVGESHTVAWIFEADDDLKPSRYFRNDPVGWNAPLYKVASVPTGFSGAASYIAAGECSGGGLLITYDKDLNKLTSVYVDGSSFHGVFSAKNFFVAVGYCNATGTAGSYDGIILKLDPSLNILEKILIGGTSDDRFYHIVKTASGYVVGGRTHNIVSNSTDILLLSLDEDLKVVKRAMIGGTGEDTMTSLAVMPNGNCAFTGNTTSVGAGGHDVLLMEIDANLNIVKQLVFGGSGAETASALVVNSNGSFTVAGHTPSAGAGNLDCFIATISGKFSDLTGSLVKYPALRVNAGPGFTVDHNFSMAVNDNNTVEVHTLSMVSAALPITVNTSPMNLLVDANAVASI